MTLITFQDGAVVFRDGQVGTEQQCCCKCTCADLAASGATWPPEVTVNGQAILSDPWITIPTEFCDGTAAAGGACLFAGERCWAGASQRFVCKASYPLPNAVANDNGVGQTLDGWMDNEVLYLILAVFLASNTSGDPRCFLFDEYRLYKINADLCCTENTDPASLSLERIINLRGQAGRGDDLTGTPLAGLGYPLPPDDDPTLCSCHDSFFVAPVVSIDCNPLP